MLFSHLQHQYETYMQQYVGHTISLWSNYNAYKFIWWLGIYELIFLFHYLCWNVSNFVCVHVSSVLISLILNAILILNDSNIFSQA